MQRNYENLQTGEIAPAHQIGSDDEGRPLYQFVEGWEPTFPYTADEDGNWIEDTDAQCESCAVVGEDSQAVTIRNNENVCEVCAAEIDSRETQQAAIRDTVYDERGIRR